jgi:hypothetical protein
MTIFGLLALGLAAVFALVIVTAFPEVRSTIVQMLMGVFIVLLAVTLIGLLLIAITGFNPDPLIRRISVMQTHHRLVDFFELLPEEYRVQTVLNEDTDGDGEKEWIVFYQFDLADGRSPYAGAVYDFDRGSPPVLFPYRLLPPDRDYLSESAVGLQLEDIVAAGEVEPILELMVYGQVPPVEKAGVATSTDLTIFRNIPNSFEWEFPRDEPRRYQVIGSFRGDGGVFFDQADKTVRVLNRAGYDRSQLAIETVYALDETRGTYMATTDPTELSAPVSTQVVFAFGMPPDILDTPYPEKLVLGFYETLAGEPSDAEPKDFLTGQALIEYERNNLAYFGFENVSGDVDQVKITQLSYFPAAEQVNPSVTVLGKDPRFLTVSVDFEATVGKADTRTSVPVDWVTTVVNGKWRIDRRL